MPIDVWNLEWLNSNEQRAYPLSDSATATDATGTFSLPPSLLVELVLPVPVGADYGGAVDPSRFYLRRVTVLPSGFTLVVAYDKSPTPVDVARAVVPRAAHSEYDAYDLVGLGDFADARGTVVVGRTEEVDLQPAGAWTFMLDGGRLDPDCVRPMIRGISSLAVRNGNDLSPRLYGDVTLVAGANVRLSITGANAIRLDAIAGEGLVESCACDSDTAVGPPITSLNGVRPRADGEFTFLGNPCLAIEQVKNGLKFHDVCSSPCCGCPELDALMKELAYFGNEATSLKAFVDHLTSKFDQFNSVVLASRLNTAPCI